MARLFFLLSTAGRPPSDGAVGSMGKEWKGTNSPNFLQDYINNQYGYGSIPINTIFRGMNIHLPAILRFTRGTRF